MSPLRFLSLLLVAGSCGAAGWFGSRAAHEGLLPSERNRARASMSTKAPAAREPALPPDSPPENWMARVKSAAPGDYAALLEEVGALFPGHSSGKREAAQKWLLGMWIARDAEAAGACVMEKNDALLSGQFAMMLARVAPEKVEAFSKGLLRYKYDLLAIAFRALAETDPRAFLKLKPEDAGAHWARHWPRAIRTLAADDPAAAAAVWTGYGMTGPASEEMLFAIVHAWQTRDPQALRRWMEGLENAEHRRLAQHAWLGALAKKDPAAALRELDKTDPGPWLPDRSGAQDARRAILTALARESPAAAIAELERLQSTIKLNEPVKASAAAVSDDPFAGDSDPAEERRLAAQELRQAVMEAIAPGLPRDPAQLLSALRKMAQDSSLSEADQRNLAGLKAREWNPATTVEALRLLLPDHAKYDPLGESLRDNLVRNLTHLDPELSVAFFASLPEAQRKEIAWDLFSSLNQNDAESMLKMAPHLPEDRWSAYIARSLAKVPEEAKGFIENLSANGNTSDVFSDFAGTWGRSDPAAAAQWLLTLPGEGPHHAALGLAAEWAVYDDVAASDWVDSLPQGLTRDGAVRGLVRGIASTDPEAAWKWAASISKYQAARAYGEVARWWGNEAPPEFVAALTEAMKDGDGSDREAALENLKRPPEERYINP
jgi:hypothetical protein